MELFEAHKNPIAASYWAPLKNGFFTAAGAPGKKRIRLWPEAGVTDVVTLQRIDEMNSWIPGSCENRNMQWHHFPLSGKHLAAPEDKESLARIPELVALLEQEDKEPRIVAHCSAGLHRTGVFLYFLLRSAGVPVEEILERVSQARRLTGDELARENSKGILAEKAEELYQEIFE